LNLKWLEQLEPLATLNRKMCMSHQLQRRTGPLAALVAAVALTALLGAPIHAQAAATMGAAAPDFTAMGADGKRHRLSDYRGSIVVLEWTNPVCGPTKRQYETGNLQATQTEAAKRKVVWLTINTAAPGKPGYLTAEAANRLTKARGATISAFLFDPDGTLGRLYAAKATPSAYVINAKGALVYQGAIDDGASPMTGKSTNYVLAALSEVRMGKPVSTPFTPQRGCPVEY